MKYNFNKSFNPEPNKQDIPQSVMKALNMSLPKGYEYRFNEKTGHFVVSPIGNVQAQPIKLSFNPESYDSFPDWAKKDPSSFAEYLYRMQIKMKIDKAFYVDPDGTTKPITDFLKDPFATSSYAEESFIIPEPFKRIDPVSFSTSLGEAKTIIFERKPYPERGFILIESVNAPELKLSFVIPEKRDAGRGIVNLSVFPQYASSVHDVVVAYSLVLGIINGTVKMNGKDAPCPMEASSKHEKEVLEYKFQRWKDLLKLEEIFDVHFDPAEKMSISDEKFLTELSTVFIKKQDLIYDEPYEYVHVNEDAVESKEFQELIANGKGGAFSFVREPEDHVLLGATIRLSIVMIIKDVKISYVETDSEGAKLHFYRALKTPWHVYKTYSRSEEEAVKEQKRIINKWLYQKED